MGVNRRGLRCATGLCKGLYKGRRVPPLRAGG